LLFPDKELMIQIAPQMRIMLAVAPADFRKGIDSLAAVCRKILKQDPFSGYIFVNGQNQRKKAMAEMAQTHTKALKKSRLPIKPSNPAMTVRLVKKASCMVKNHRPESSG
jgi:hypothetical protein